MKFKFFLKNSLANSDGLTRILSLTEQIQIEREKVRRMHQNMNRGNSNKTLKDISNTGNTPKKTKSKECLALKAVIRPKAPKSNSSSANFQILTLNSS